VLPVEQDLTTGMSGLKADRKIVGMMGCGRATEAGLLLYSRVGQSNALSYGKNFALF
jgi:hypothetical protein